MNTKTQTENQRWEALRERIKELAIEPKLNYNTNKGDTKMEEYKVVNRGKRGNKKIVLSVHYSHIGAVAVLDQLRSWKPSGNFAIIKNELTGAN